MLSQLLKDRQFIFALSIAIPVWLGAYFWGMRGDSALPVYFQLILLSVVVFPIVEELSFRGFIQGYLLAKPGLRKKYLGLTLANCLTSMVFVALHFLVQKHLFAFLVIFPSLIFGHFRERYNSVLPAIVLHIIYNMGWVTALSLGG